MRLQLGEHGHSGLCHTPHTERTLRIPLADCEGVIEELSKAMEEGLSAVLDKGSLP